ncbi:Hypothetical predicted protein, partial [Mytilus galloprovincialis]
MAQVLTVPGDVRHGFSYMGQFNHDFGRITGIAATKRGTFCSLPNTRKDCSSGTVSCFFGENKDGCVYAGAANYEQVYPNLEKLTKNEIYNIATLDSPTDICSDDNGQIYVSGHGSNNIHRLVEDKKYLSFTRKEETDYKLLDIPLNAKHGIKEPVALCFNQDYGKLYI